MLLATDHETPLDSTVVLFPAEATCPRRIPLRDLSDGNIIFFAKFSDPLGNKMEGPEVVELLIVHLAVVSVSLDACEIAYVKFTDAPLIQDREEMFQQRALPRL